MTDEVLLKRASCGDESAFMELYERHRGAVFRFAYRFLGSVEIAEDISHDCFLSLMQNPERYDPTRAALRSYLFAAARNLAMKHFRKTRDEETLDETSRELPMPASHQPLSLLLDEEVTQVVRRAVALLSPLQRETLILFEYEECSLTEIAQVVGADVGTVKARLHRARQAMKRSMSGYFKSVSGAVVYEEACK
jgi:RNA polymerase sigma-70 factor (ECF subfamily)